MRRAIAATRLLLLATGAGALDLTADLARIHGNDAFNEGGIVMIETVAEFTRP